jgi:hypothetical protein
MLWAAYNFYLMVKIYLVNFHKLLQATFDCAVIIQYICLYE